MSGTKLGGIKAAATNRAKYGEDFYATMGKKGGMKGHTGGFFANRELARTAGSKGGRVSRRGSDLQKKLDEVFSVYIALEIEKGSSVHHIAQKIGVSDSTIGRYLKRHGLSTKKS